MYSDSEVTIVGPRYWVLERSTKRSLVTMDPDDPERDRQNPSDAAEAWGRKYLSQEMDSVVVTVLDVRSGRSYTYRVALDIFREVQVNQLQSYANCFGQYLLYRVVDDVGTYRGQFHYEAYPVSRIKDHFGEGKYHLLAYYPDALETCPTCLSITVPASPSLPLNQGVHQMHTEANVRKYVIDQLRVMCAAPGMFGNPESFELQYLQLLEVWIVASYPEIEARHPRFVLDAYGDYRFEVTNSAATLSSKLSLPELVKALEGFREALGVKLGAPIAAPKRLRIGRFYDDTMIDEQVFSKQENVTIGPLGKARFCESSIKETFDIFQVRDSKYYFNFTEDMRGRVGPLKGAPDVLPLQELRAIGLAKYNGSCWQVPLLPESRGRVTAGDTTLLFQFVDVSEQVAK